MSAHETVAAEAVVHVDIFTNGLLDPSAEMLGPVSDRGRIVASTAPGCWGPMITPAIRGGHEVTRPVAVEGAEVGDAIAITITKIAIDSIATASGVGTPIEGRFHDDPFVAAHCPGCGKEHPPTHTVGIGYGAVRCDECGEDASPFTVVDGYTIAFDRERSVGVTLPQAAAEAIAEDAERYAALPANSIQNPMLVFAPHDLVGVATRVRPFLGQLGTLPSIVLPDSHNAGDFGARLVGAAHQYAVTEEALAGRTDGHMDIDTVGEGTIVVCPVKVAGGGVYLGDMHALQGDGEIAGHTCDVAGTVELQVEVIKGLAIDGPILLPRLEDLPPLARPLSREERARATETVREWGLKEIERSAPISVVGTGPDLNRATDNGLERTAALLDTSVAEVMNRATITGAIEIGRHPGVVHVTLLAPLASLERAGLQRYAERQYGDSLAAA